MAFNLKIKSLYCYIKTKESRLYFIIFKTLNDDNTF